MTPSTGNQMRWTVTLNRITISLGWNIVGILWDNVSTHQAILYIYIYTLLTFQLGRAFMLASCSSICCHFLLRSIWF